MGVLFGTQSISKSTLGRARSKGQRGHLTPRIRLKARTNFWNTAKHVDFFAQRQKFGLVKGIGELSCKIYRGRCSRGNNGIGSTSNYRLLNKSRFSSSVSPDIENNFSGHNKLLKLGLTRA